MTPISYTQRNQTAKQLLKSLKQAKKAVTSESGKKAEMLLAELRADQRAARWNPRYDSLMLIASDKSDLFRAIRAVEIAIKISNYIATGKSDKSPRVARAVGSVQSTRSSNESILIMQNGSIYGEYPNRPTAYNGMRLSNHDWNKPFKCWDTVAFDREFPKMAKLGFSYVIRRMEPCVINLGFVPTVINAPVVIKQSA